jgi:protein O-mannosyl-transferase
MGKAAGKKKKSSVVSIATERPGPAHAGGDKASTQKAAGTAGNGYARYYLAALVALVTFLVYFTSLQNGFVQFDDPGYVLDNTHIRSLNTALLTWAFFKFYFANWHPLTWMSHALDYRIWELNPLGHHLTNNILHSVNSFLVVVLVMKLFGLFRKVAITEGSATPVHDRGVLIAAGVTGVLFGLHPLHVESVAWVAERKDLLCGLFFLLSVTAYLQYVTKIDFAAGQGAASRFPNRHYVLSFVFFVLALLSKPMAVSLPVVLLIIDWYPSKRIQSLASLWQACIEKIPFIALSFVSSIVTVLAQKSGDAMEMMKFVPLSTRLTVAAKAIIAYMGKMIMPLNLIPYYPYQMDASVFSAAYLIPVLLIIGITFFCLRAAGRNRLWLSIWSYYLITLLPVLGIIQVGGQAMADRYTYLPSLGPFLLIGLMVARVSAPSSGTEKDYQRTSLAAVLAAVLLVMTMTSLTINQIRIWKNSFSLWNYVIEKQKIEEPFVYNNRGAVFVDMGQFEKAIEDQNKAIALDPFYYNSYVNRGFAYSEIGQLDKASQDFDKAIALNPRGYQAYMNKGVLYGKMGSFEKAAELLSKAIAIRPDVPSAYMNRAIAYSMLKEYDKALDDISTVIGYGHNLAEAYGTRASIYLNKGDRQRAILDFQRACDLGDNRGCNALKSISQQAIPHFS